MRTLVVVLMMTMASVARAQLPCPLNDGANPSIGTLSTWRGEIAGPRGTRRRPITCTICASVIEVVDAPALFVQGSCVVPHFRHRRLVGIGAAPGGPGTGEICRRIRPIARGNQSNEVDCCQLALPLVMFDEAHPPTSLSGAFQCPHKSGTFTLSSEMTP